MRQYKITIFFVVNADNDFGVNGKFKELYFYGSVATLFSIDVKQLSYSGPCEFSIAARWNYLHLSYYK